MDGIDGWDVESSSVLIQVTFFQPAFSIFKNTLNTRVTMIQPNTNLLRKVTSYVRHFPSQDRKTVSPFATYFLSPVKPFWRDGTGSRKAAPGEAGKHNIIQFSMAGVAASAL